MSETINKKQAIIEMVRDGAKFVTESCDIKSFHYIEFDGDTFKYNKDGFDTDIVFHKTFTRYVEPNKKIKMWKWLFLESGGNYYFETQKFYTDKESAEISLPRSKIIKPLPYTEIEVEVE